MRGGIKRRGGKPRWNLDGAAKEGKGGGGGGLEKASASHSLFTGKCLQRGNTARTVYVQYPKKREIKHRT